MSKNEAPQSATNHARYDPKFHYVVLPVFAVTFLGTVVHAVQARDFLHMWLALVAFCALVAVLTTRTYSLRVQDRVIRLEERLRLRDLAPEGFRARIGELSTSQLIALRFASDEEVYPLAERALNESLSAKQIKASIRNWRPDYLRV